MQTKSWYKSKTVWTAVVGGVLGVAQALGMDIPLEAYAFLGSFGLYSLRVGDKSIK